MANQPPNQDTQDVHAAAAPTDVVQDEPYSIFNKSQKALIVSIVSIAATFTALASNIYFPALPTIANDLGVSIELVNLSVTTYLILQGIAPSLWGPISDVRGRRVAYFFTFLVFIGACIGLALTQNYATLLVLRCLQSAGSASTIAIGSGVIGDITTRADRGSYIGIFQAGLLVPVAIGPIIGGALAGTLGWRSIFWLLTIYAGCFLAGMLLFLPETLRSIVGNGSHTSHVFAKFVLITNRKPRAGPNGLERVASAPAPRKSIDLLGPFRILFSKFAAPLVVFLAIYYAVWQMSLTAMSTLFQERYGLTETQTGLTFIANGAGSITGTLVTGRILDKDYQKVKRAYDNHSAERGSRNSDSDASADFPLEKARLRLLPIFAILQCLAIILFGWCIEFPRTVPIAIPIISTFVTGWTVQSTQSIVTTYLVDLFSDRSAAASASMNLARCLLAAGGTSFVMPMINAIGVGLAFTVCVVVQIVALSGVFVTWKFAGKWRIEEKENEKRRHG